MQDSSGIEELPPLSDDDINILFNIVSLAQQSPNPPFKALFAAYDKVLDENDIAPEHDQRFFRYLLRLGENGGHSTRDLVLRLRKLLAKLDIHIVVDENDEELDIEEDDEKQDDFKLKTEQPGSGKRSRRASFNDTNLDETWLDGGRLESVRPEHKLQPPADQLRPPRQQQYAPVASNAAPPRGRVASKPLLNARSRSLSTQGSVRVKRSVSREPWARQDSATHQNQVATLSDSLSDIPSSPPVAPASHAIAPQDPEPTDSELISDADAFLYTSSIKTARHCLHSLRQGAAQLRDLRQIAENHDHRLLKAQAFSIWAAKVLERRQDAETERFFDHYERRATRARDLFLLNKAFTHWAQSTSDEVVRTSVAKRHILRTRYFNAWRDITAVNDFKCRRLGLRKWFSVWKNNAARKAVDNERAVAVYQENLVERTYWKWFWEFCEHKAPVWHDHRVRTNCMHRLTHAVALYRQHEAAALRLRDANLLRKTFGKLTTRKLAIQSLDQTADRHRHVSLVGNCLHKLQQESKLGYASKQISVPVTRRLLSTAVSIWQHNTQISKQAEAANRYRLLRNAWTAWNDGLRTRALSQRIDDRIILESLYKWVLQSRLSLFRRVMDSRLQERVLQTLSLKLTEQRFRLNEATAIFEQHQRRRKLASVMLKFHGKTRTEEMMERQALEFRNSHVMDAIMPIWTQKTRHLQILNRWSKDARFYCLTTSTLKKWTEATTEAKRNKRRDAYVTIRRKIKTRMVQECLQTWREKTATIKQIEQQATEHSNARIINTSTAAFDHWRSTTQHTLSLTLQAEIFRARTLFLQAISLLASKGQEILSHHSQALSIRSQAIDLIAAETLKKLKWKLFCQRRSEDSAVALEQRNLTQHRRNMLRYWAEQATRRRASRTLPMAGDGGEVRGDFGFESPTRLPPTPYAPPPPPPQQQQQQQAPIVPNLFSSLRLPSARKPTRPFAASTNLNTRLRPWEETSDAEMDFGATARAEEWTGFNMLDSLSQPSFLPQPQPQPQDFYPQQQQRNVERTALGQSITATPQPGYMRTPSRTARAKARFRVTDTAPRSRLREVMVNSTTPKTFGMTPVFGAVETTSTTTPAPAPAPAPPKFGDGQSQTPRVTPFESKMRKGGYIGVGGGSVGKVATSTPATFRRTRFGGSTTAAAFGRSGIGAATGRSVRFFDADGQGQGKLEDTDEEVDGDVDDVGDGEVDDGL